MECYPSAGDLIYKRANQAVDLFGNVMTGGIFKGAGNLFRRSAPTYSTPSLPAPRPALPAPRGYLPYKR